MSDFGQLPIGQHSASNAEIGRAVLAYVPPETTASKASDFRGDIYSLGLILYFMLEGEHPETRQPSPPTEAVAGVHSALAPLATRMTAVYPSDRHQSYAELLDDIDQVLSAIAGLVHLDLDSSAFADRDLT